MTRNGNKIKLENRITTLEVKVSDLNKDLNTFINNHFEHLKKDNQLSHDLMFSKIEEIKKDLGSKFFWLMSTMFGILISIIIILIKGIF